MHCFEEAGPRASAGAAGHQGSAQHVASRRLPSPLHFCLAATISTAPGTLPSTSRRPGATRWCVSCPASLLPLRPVARAAAAPPGVSAALLQPHPTHLSLAAQGGTMDIATALDHFINKGQVPPRWVGERGKWGRHARPPGRPVAGGLVAAASAGVSGPLLTCHVSTTQRSTPLTPAAARSTLGLAPMAAPGCWPTPPRPPLARPHPPPGHRAPALVRDGGVCVIRALRSAAVSTTCRQPVP